MIRHSVFSLLILGCTLAVNDLVPAQPSSAGQTSQDKKKPKAETPEDSDSTSARASRHAFAVQLVSSLADEFRSSKDESLRVKVQARAADILWNVDRERAYVLFDRAWAAAETFDTESRRKHEEERTRFLSGRGGIGFIPQPANFRAEVLQLAAKHDRALAERFLAKLEEEDKRDEEAGRPLKRWDPTEPPETIAKRLRLARQLLESGDLERALLVAQPGLHRVTSDGIILLVLLRQKNAVSADQLFESLLERSATDPLADATSVSLLSAYVATPSVLVTYTRDGMMVNPWTTPLPAPHLTPSLRAKFFSVAGQILLRPGSPSDLELNSAGLVGTYFMISRLLPLFQENVPAIAAALQTKLSALSEGTHEIIPPEVRSFLNAGFQSTEREDEAAEDIQDVIARTSSQFERNHLYAMAAHKSALKGDWMARALADKIDDKDLKERVRNFVDFILVSKALEKKDLDKALQLARSSELSHLQRAWAYAEIAALTRPSSPTDAMEFLLEAARETGRIDVTNSESAQSWVAVARRGVEVEQPGQWDRVRDAIKAVNRASEYAGEENEIPVSFQSKFNLMMMRVPAPSSSLPALFSVLAKQDLYRAADLARTITNEPAKAIALLAVAKSAFDERPARNKR